MTLVKVKPGFSNSYLMSTPFGNLFSDFFNTVVPEERQVTPTIPKVNISETEKAYKLEVAVPGLSKKDINISVDNDVLTISAELEKEEKEYLRQEFNYRQFVRKFTLTDDIDQEAIKASFSNGVLEITLNKKEIVVDRPKTIKIS